jgi:hypothetical protein
MAIRLIGLGITGNSIYSGNGNPKWFRELHRPRVSACRAEQFARMRYGNFGPALSNHANYCEVSPVR